MAVGLGVVVEVGVAVACSVGEAPGDAVNGRADGVALGCVAVVEVGAGARFVSGRGVREGMLDTPACKSEASRANS